MAKVEDVYYRILLFYYIFPNSSSLQAETRYIMSWLPLFLKKKMTDLESIYSRFLFTYFYLEDSGQQNFSGLSVKLFSGLFLQVW